MIEKLPMVERIEEYLLELITHDRSQQVIFRDFNDRKRKKMAFNNNYEVHKPIYKLNKI